MTTEPSSPWLTTQEAAAYIKFSRKVVVEACRNGTLKHTRPGRGKILTKREWLDEWLLQSVEGGTTIGA